jgi:hypothetical protein
MFALHKGMDVVTCENFVFLGRGRWYYQEFVYFRIETEMSALELKTEYQLENALSKVLEEHKDQIDELLTKYGDKEKDTAILYRFLKAWEFDMKQTEESLSGSIKWKEEHNFWQLMEDVKDKTSKDFPHANIISRFSYEKFDFHTKFEIFEFSCAQRRFLL